MKGFGADAERSKVRDERGSGGGGRVVVDGDGAAEAGEAEGGGFAYASGTARDESEMWPEVRQKGHCGLTDVVGKLAIVTTED